MKKLIISLISLFMIICLIACGCASAGNGGSAVTGTGQEGLQSSDSAGVPLLGASGDASGELSAELGELKKKQEDAGPVDSPYMQQHFMQLSETGRLALSKNMKKISAAADTEKSGVLFSGPVAHYNGGRVAILGTFEFDGNPVGRVSLSGATDSAHDVNVRLYLDDDEEPVSVFALDHSDGEDWNVGHTHTQDVYGQIAAGSHRISLEFDVEDAKGNEEVNILLRHVEFSESSGIPVIYFNIDESKGTIDDMNSSPDHSVKCYGTIDIQVPEGYECDYSGACESISDLAMNYVSGRGNSTWKDPDKKPYKFKLEKKTDLFGMGKSKNWALVANRFDNSLVRNRMTYWLGAELGMEFTPQCIPVDVVMGDEYYGSYILAENVRIDSGRVNIDELTEDDVQEPEITGGHLIAMNPYYEEDERSVFVTGQRVRFINDNPDFAYEDDGDFHGNDAQRDYIRDYMQQTEDAIFGDGFADERGTGYADLMDMDAAIDYWWVQELSENGDAYTTDSTKLYKKREGKLFWGPLWDFDYVAWGNLQKPGQYRTEGFTNTTTPWFDRLAEDDSFVSKLIDRWPVVNEKITEIVKDGGLLDRYYEETAISERYDVEKHGFFREFNPWGPDEPDDLTYEDEVEQLRGWLSSRQDWINEHLDGLAKQIAEVTFIAFDEVVEVQNIKKGKRISHVPEAPKREGYYFMGWFTEDGTEVDGWLAINDDMNIYGRYIDEETASKADHLYFKQTVHWADLNDVTYTTYFKTTPADAIIHTVDWASSDESIATVADNGTVTLLGTGTVTITGTVRSGFEASYELNIYDSGVVRPIFCEGIQVAYPSMTIHVGESMQNIATLLPEGTPLRAGIIVSVSNDTTVAMSDECCVVTGINPGTATVTVREYHSDCETTFEVTVLPAEGGLQGPGGQDVPGGEIDLVKQALETLRRIDDQVDPSYYTQESYAIYINAFGNAVDRLQNDVMFPILIDDLVQQVVKAQQRLEPKKTQN